MRGWLSTTFLSILICLLGIGSIFLPWGFVEGRGGGGWLLGLLVWQGWVAAFLFLALLLFLIVTGAMQPVPFSRSLVLFLGAAVNLALLFVSFLVSLPSPGQIYGDRRQPDGQFIFAGYGSALGAGLAILLLLVSALEMRGCVIRRTSARGGAVDQSSS